MKKCSNCNVEMLEGSLYGKPRFIDMDHEIDKFYFDVETGGKGDFLGIEYNKSKRLNFNAYTCPKCGKIEFYINPDNLK